MLRQTIRICSAFALVISLAVVDARPARHRRHIKNKFFDKTLEEQETTLTDEDFENAEELEEQGEVQRGRNPMINTGMFEGDIANPGLDASTVGQFMGTTTNHDGGDRGRLSAAVTKDKFRRWPNNRLPFIISNQLLAQGRSAVANAIRTIERVSCFRFHPRTDDDQDYIYIMIGNGCYSSLGRIGGKQNVSLGYGCYEKGTILHELMHAIGFFHEQSRPDRDDYVTILWKNIQNGEQGQFEKYNTTEVETCTPYDYHSVMHYRSKAFSKNEMDTIQPKTPGVRLNYQNDFSSGDIVQLNKFGRCKGHAGCRGGFYTDYFGDTF